MYLGRVVGVGRTEEGNPMAVYAVSGRSKKSKERKAILYPSTNPRIVRIRPSTKITKEQKKSSDLLFYNAIISTTRLKKRVNSPFLVVGNGIHTDEVYRKWEEDDPQTLVGHLDYVKKTLEEFGPETDKLKTPRIIGGLISYDEDIWISLGMITDFQFSDYLKLPDKEKVYWISTYSGESDEKPEAPRFKNLRDIVKILEFKGKSTQDLADQVFDWMDREFVVCTAVAVYNKGRWDLAVRNKHK